MESILNTVKQTLGLSLDYTPFDQALIIHINSALMTLGQLGLGPEEGFSITGDDETWTEFLGSRIDLEGVKTYVYQRVQLDFDPPASSFALTAIKESVKELEWRLNIFGESDSNG